MWCLGYHRCQSILRYRFRTDFPIVPILSELPVNTYTFEGDQNPTGIVSFLLDVPFSDEKPFKRLMYVTGMHKGKPFLWIFCGQRGANPHCVIVQSNCKPAWYCYICCVHTQTDV